MSINPSKHAVTIVLSAVTAIVVVGGIVGAHNRPDRGHVKFAHKVEGFTRYFKKVNPSVTAGSTVAARSAAGKVQLAAKGPFKIYGKCFKVNTNPDNPGVFAETYIKTRAGGAVFSSESNDSGNDFLKPSTTETARSLVTQSSFAGVGDPGVLNISDAENFGFWAAVRRVSLAGEVFVGSKVGNPEEGNGVYGPGSGCLFGGRVFS